MSAVVYKNTVSPEDYKQPEKGRGLGAAVPR